MIPLRDLNPTRRTPVVTWAIVGLNVLVFAMTWDALDDYVFDFGAVAYHFTGFDPMDNRLPGGGSYQVPDDGRWFTRAVAHMWLHAGILHIAGNMWFLWVFGDNVEDRLGRGRFIAFYLLSGVVALVAQVAYEPSSSLPMVGASGALAGVLGAYLRLFPTARVLGLVPIAFLFISVVWPAAVFLGIWAGMQLLQAMISDGGGGVAWWAHLGGFAFGWLVVPLFRPKGRRRVEVVVRRRR